MPARPRTSTLAAIRFLGGAACLDFVNTVEPRSGSPGHDVLSAYLDVVTWCERANLVNAATGDSLAAVADLEPLEARRAFGRIIVLREATYAAFARIANRAQPIQNDLRTIEQALRSGCPRRQLAADSRDSYGWEYDHDLLLPLWLLADAAVGLLTSDQLSHVKQCPGAGDCGWLFLDTTKNQRRHWCRSNGCGARVKMRRRYQRKNAEQVSRRARSS